MSSRRTPGPITTDVGSLQEASARSLIREAAAWVPAFAGTTKGKSAGASNLSGDVLLHPVGDLDQPPPRPLEERHHAIHVAVARQRNFDLALALGHLRLRLFQRVRLRQRLGDLAGARPPPGPPFRF